MEIIIISIVAFLTAILTFFSGFGLGTLLTPVFMLFFPIDIAIGLCGIVHFANNLFKFFLVGKHANKEVLLKFGVPAIIAAFVGSWLLLQISDLAPVFSYSLFGKQLNVFPVKFIIASLLVIFALLDLIPFLSKMEFGKDKLPLGGVLSGFFGGLSGHQGALRSAFLIKAGLSKESFIATGIVVSMFIDFTRLSVYASKITTYTWDVEYIDNNYINGFNYAKLQEKRQKVVVLIKIKEKTIDIKAGENISIKYQCE